MIQFGDAKSQAARYHEYCSRSNAVYKSPTTPDSATFALNSLATCSGFPARDPAGNVLQPSCSGTTTAKVDGVPVDFSAKFICTYKTNGAKSEYFVRATYLPETTMVKELTVTVHEEGGQYTIAGTALSPGVGYFENVNSVYPFPKDSAAVTLAVTKFAAAGAGLTATFSIGDITSQPGGKGNLRTITEGTVDIKMTP